MDQIGNGDTTGIDVILPVQAAVCWATSLENYQNTFWFKLFPNPVVDILKIDLQGKAEVQKVRIYTMLGTLTKEEKGIAQLDISSLSKGIYLIEIKTNKGVLHSRFLKE